MSTSPRFVVVSRSYELPTSVGELSLAAPPKITSSETIKIDRAGLKEFVLPNELWDKVFEPLQLGDVKSARLVSKLWGDLGKKFIFKSPFVFRPDRKDLERMERLLPYLSSFPSVRSLRFETGNRSCYAVGWHMRFNYAREYNTILFNTHHAKSSKTEIESEKTNAIQEYVSWNNRCYLAKQNYRQIGALVKIFKEMKNLDTIEVMRKNCIHQNALLRTSWIDGDDNTNFAIINRELEMLLTALQSSAVELKRLVHDELPVTFFSQEPEYLRYLSVPLQNLETLHLNFDATMPPLLKFWTGLGEVLRSIRCLKNLRFGFAFIDRGIVNEGNWEVSENPIEWYVPLWKLLGNHTWKDLKVLRIDGMMFCEKGLVEFLSRHKSTLRDLELFQIGLWQGSFQGLLSWMSEHLSLEDFKIWGYLRAWHASYDETWRLPPFSTLQTDLWAPILDEYLIEAYMENNNRPGDFSPCPCTGEYLRDFVLHGGEWDMTEDDALGMPYDFSHHSIDCTDCDIDNSYLDAAWNDSDTDFDLSWEWSIFSRMRDDSDLQRVTNVYTGAGYDFNGYDEEGFNRQGVHYDDEEIEWCGYKGALGGAKLERQIMQEIIRGLRVSSQSETKN